MGETGDASVDMQVDAPPAPPAAPAAPAAVEPSPTTPVEIGNGLPLGFTGQYELHAVVTHKGRSADSGHYMGWVRQAPGSQLWWCYNDDKVTETNTEAVSTLFACALTQSGAHWASQLRIHYVVVGESIPVVYLLSSPRTPHRMQVLKLCGGGDADMAYLNFYRFREHKK
jgi:hypothetical protein